MVFYCIAWYCIVPFLALAQDQLQIWSPCTKGDPVEGVVYVGEDVEQMGGVELSCKSGFFSQNFNFFIIRLF